MDELISHLKKNPATQNIPIVVLAGRKTASDTEPEEKRGDFTIFKDIAIEEQMEKALKARWANPKQPTDNISQGSTPPARSFAGPQDLPPITSDKPPRDHRRVVGGKRAGGERPHAHHLRRSLARTLCAEENSQPRRR